jgi:hypothetical protein
VFSQQLESARDIDKHALEELPSREKTLLATQL